MHNKKHVFIVGIKGTAMVQIAIILKKMGIKVTGSDVDESFITDELLKKHSISVQSGFAIDLITKDIDLVLYSAAHGGTANPIVEEAKKRNITTQSQASFLGELLKNFKTTIAVSGCHGKTTTTSLAAYAFIRMGLSPSYLVGTSSFAGYDGGDFQKKDFFIIEADEYGVNPPLDPTPKLHFIHPHYIICTNIDFDHPDVYRDLNHTKDEFTHFFNGSQLILNADDKNLSSIFGRLKNGFHTYGQSHDADLRYEHIRTDGVKTFFDVFYKGEPLGTFSTHLAGAKNVSNTASVILLLLTLGYESNTIKKAIADFAGPARRFELVADLNKFTLLDDYGHHPHEIEATIEAARARYPHRRVILVFQPHTFSRTYHLKSLFASSLGKADKVFLMPIFPSAREKSADFPVTSEDIVNEAKKLGDVQITAVKSTEDLLTKMGSELLSGDVIFTLGAGDVYKLKNDIITLIQSYGSKSPN